MARRSIAGALMRGFAWVGAGGLLILLASIVLAYHITFGGLSDPHALSRAISEVAAHVLLPALVIVLPMAVAGRGIVRRALAPMQDAAQAVTAANSSALGVRIDSSDFPAEVAPLALGVNELLERMDAIVESNAAFAADVAHELRTPLTVLGLELDRLDCPVADGLRRQVRDMQKLVGQLMTIARLDAREQRRTPLAEVSLVAVAANLVAQMAPAAHAVGRRLAFEDRGGAAIAGEAEALTAALRNLIDNALRVTPAGAAVTVVAGPGPLLGVVDGGDGLHPQDLERLTGRHARADHASTEGAGLGLAIVGKILQLHGGTLVTDPVQRKISMVFRSLRG